MSGESPVKDFAFVEVNCGKTTELRFLVTYLHAFQPHEYRSYIWETRVKYSNEQNSMVAPYRITREDVLAIALNSLGTDNKAEVRSIVQLVQMVRRPGRQVEPLLLPNGTKQRLSTWVITTFNTEESQESYRKVRVWYQDAQQKFTAILHPMSERFRTYVKKDFMGVMDPWERDQNSFPDMVAYQSIEDGGGALYYPFPIMDPLHPLSGVEKEWSHWTFRDFLAYLEGETQGATYYEDTLKLAYGIKRLHYPFLDFNQQRAVIAELLDRSVVMPSGDIPD